MRVYLGGDIALHGLISSESEANEGRFRWLSELLSASDGLIANLEAPVVSEVDISVILTPLIGFFKEQMFN